MSLRTPGGSGRSAPPRPIRCPFSPQRQRRKARPPPGAGAAAGGQAVGYQPLPRLGDHGGHGTLADRGHLLGFEGQLAPVVVPAEPADDDRPLPAHRPAPPGGPSRADDRDLGRPVAQGEIGPPCLRHLGTVHLTLDRHSPDPGDRPGDLAGQVDQAQAAGLGPTGWCRALPGPQGQGHAPAVPGGGTAAAVPAGGATTVPDRGAPAAVPAGGTAATRPWPAEVPRAAACRHSSTSMAWMPSRRAWWRPPSKPVGKNTSTMSHASTGARIRAPSARTLASLCWRARRAVYSSWHSAARAPWTLLAAICSPWPEPPTTMPSWARPWTT